MHITKTTFITNGLDPKRKEICHPSNGAIGSTWGGAIFMGSTRSIDPDATDFTLEKGELSCVLEEVHFEQNIAGNGGAIAFVRALLLQLDDVKFVANNGTNGGAMFFELDGDPHPQVDFNSSHYVNGGGLSFHQNTARRGGALYIHVRCGAGLDLVGISPYNVTRFTANGAANNEDAVFIVNSEFIGNNAIESGGAWHVNGGRVGCLSCNFSNNSVQGGSSAEGGAIALVNKAALHARKIALMQNSAKHGGAINARDSLVDIVESGFIANVARENGGGLCIRKSATLLFRSGIVGVVENSTFDGNRGEVGGGCMCICCFWIHITRAYSKRFKRTLLE